MVQERVPLLFRFIQSAAQVELAQFRNKICKRESYQLEAVQYDCASTGSGQIAEPLLRWAIESAAP